MVLIAMWGATDPLVIGLVSLVDMTQAIAFIAGGVALYRFRSEFGIAALAAGAAEALMGLTVLFFPETNLNLLFQFVFVSYGIFILSNYKPENNEFDSHELLIFSD